MKLPILPGLPALTFGLLLMASTALAQPLHFNQIDGNRDGLLSRPELEEAFGSAEFSAEFILSLDQNDDGQLSRDEVRAAAGDGQRNGEGDADGEDGKGADGTDKDGEDGDRGHGNDEDGFDGDNPGQGHGDDAVPGGGRGGDNPGWEHGSRDDND